MLQSWRDRQSTPTPLLVLSQLISLGRQQILSLISSGYVCRICNMLNSRCTEHVTSTGPYIHCSSHLFLFVIRRTLAGYLDCKMVHNIARWFIICACSCLFNHEFLSRPNVCDMSSWLPKPQLL